MDPNSQNPQVVGDPIKKLDETDVQPTGDRIESSTVEDVSTKGNDGQGIPEQAISKKGDLLILIATILTVAAFIIVIVSILQDRFLGVKTIEPETRIYPTVAPLFTPSSTLPVGAPLDSLLSSPSASN